MKLKEYLLSNSISAWSFGKSIGNKSDATVYRWLRGEKTPSRKMMRRIYDATDGLVTANDFYDTPSKEEEK